PTPPPETSPLSLHDALPIYGGRARPAALRPHARAPHDRRLARARRGDHGRRGPPSGGARDPRPADRRRPRRGDAAEGAPEQLARDRKSTRLNSSHSQISYAV